MSQDKTFQDSLHDRLIYLYGEAKKAKLEGNENKLKELACSIAFVYDAMCIS